MSDQTLYSYTLECAAHCGSKIELINHHKTRDDTDAVAEFLGWATVDTGKIVGVYCPDCIALARQIVATVGAKK